MFVACEMVKKDSRKKNGKKYATAIYTYLMVNISDRILRFFVVLSIHKNTGEEK